MIYAVGDIFEGMILETCKDASLSRPRVRPLDFFPETMRVEFPRGLREQHPLGSRFRATVQVCQKHNSDGSVKGVPYLHAKTPSIVQIESHVPRHVVMAIPRLSSKSGLVYDYVDIDAEPLQSVEKSEHEKLRTAAWAAAVEIREAVHRVTAVRTRNPIIGMYAISRSGGACEACDSPAPFIRKNGIPYLEVHHITELSNGGADSPDNVAAICPNCHARVTYGQDAASYNQLIRERIARKESVETVS